MYFDDCCRNAAITTVNNPGGHGTYVEARINSNYCNNSPKFRSIPVPYFEAGRKYTYSHGAYDPDNDSMRFEMTTPQGRLGGAAQAPPNPVDVTFLAGMRKTKPLLLDVLDPGHRHLTQIPLF